MCLGGRAMEIVHGDKDLERYMREAVKVSEKSPVLLDRFLDDAIEVDVDCIADADGQVLIGGIMEHVEAAGIHSGDSACSLPPYSLRPALQDEMRRQAAAMAKALKVVGLMNTQFAIQGEGDEAVVYVLEVNPRASRTVPYVSKATGQPLARIAARCMAGQSLASQRDAGGKPLAEVIPPYFSIKEAVFPFNKFPGVDPILGPEMRSTGEVMGVGRTFGEAMLKSQLGAGSRLPDKGTVVITVKNSDKARAVKLAGDLTGLGFMSWPPGGPRQRLPPPASRCVSSTRSRTAGRILRTWSRAARSSSSTRRWTKPAPLLPIHATSAPRRWPTASPITRPWPAPKRQPKP
jgi:carbamoyl-phosphate synthase large subunit